MGEPALRADARRTFLVRVRPEADALLRILGPFAVQGAEILALEAERGEAAMSVRIEAGGLSAELAAHLVARLRAMPVVVQVGAGWRVTAT